MPLDSSYVLPPWGELTRVKVKGGRVRKAFFLDLFMVHGACSILDRLALEQSFLHNLVEGRFTGSIFPDNPNYTELGGIKRYATVARLADSGLAAVR